MTAQLHRVKSLKHDTKFRQVPSHRLLQRKSHQLVILNRWSGSVWRYTHLAWFFKTRKPPNTVLKCTQWHRNVFPNGTFQRPWLWVFLTSAGTAGKWWVIQGKEFLPCSFPMQSGTANQRTKSWTIHTDYLIQCSRAEPLKDSPVKSTPKCQSPSGRAPALPFPGSSHSTRHRSFCPRGSLWDAMI